MRIRISLEAEMSDAALTVYPPNAFGRQNLWDYVRQLYLTDLMEAIELCSDKNLEPAMLAALQHHNEVDIEIGKQFDHTFNVEFLP